MNELRQYRNQITGQPGLIIDVYPVSEVIAERVIEEKAVQIAGKIDHLVPIVNLTENEEMAQENALDLIENILEGTDHRIVILIHENFSLSNFYDAAGNRLDDILEEYNVTKHKNDGLEVKHEALIV